MAERIKLSIRETTIPQRVEWLENPAEDSEARKEELAEVIVCEAGKTISSAHSQVERRAECFRRGIKEIRAPKDDTAREERGARGMCAIVKYEPVGAARCVTPYDYHFTISALQVTSALVTGNAVILKSASKTPISAAVLTGIVNEAGVPTGTFNFISGRVSNIGDQLAVNERINAIAMTDSAGKGEHVASESEKVDLHMGLSRNTPAFIVEDADLEEVVRRLSRAQSGTRASSVPGSPE